jgi:hypothetical protein
MIPKVFDFGTFQILGFWIRDAQLVKSMQILQNQKKIGPKHFGYGTFNGYYKRKLPLLRDWDGLIERSQGPLFTVLGYMGICLIIIC